MKKIVSASKIDQKMQNEVIHIQIISDPNSPENPASPHIKTGNKFPKKRDFPNKKLT